MNDILYSVIIPHKDSIETLPRLINSIPNRFDIEIIIVDNSEKRITKSDICVDRNYTLLYSDSSKYAGGARNLGIENAQGRWLIFADSDDFFCEHAFDVFDNYRYNLADIIYFKSNSVYNDTLEQSNRHIPFVNIIDNYLLGKISEIELRLSIIVPWAKLIRKSFIVSNCICFDEVLAANDVMFSVKSGYCASKIEVSNNFVYVVTLRRGSLSQRWDYKVVKSRYLVSLRKNQYLKANGLNNYQVSIMFYLVKSFSFGYKTVMEFMHLALYYKQNIFIGWKKWPKTILSCYKKKKEK